jgi:formylglycine-generating enzyme required for sulfatase activity
MSPDEGTLRERLLAAFARTDEIFAALSPDALSLRPIALRHPLVFYLGHLPAFAYNQVARGALGLGHLHPTFDQLFARGIDPATELDAPELAAWPPVSDVLRYRDDARAAVLGLIGDVLARESEDPLCRYGRVLSLVIEHELMHQETLQYLFAQCPNGVVVRRPHTVPPPRMGAGREARVREVPAGEVWLGADFERQRFGWDNEFPQERVAVEAFAMDDLPVRNRDWVEFVRAIGAEADPSLRATSLVYDAEHRAKGVRTVFGEVSFELAEGWPAQVSAAQARAYCAHKGGRLPTEAELHHAARRRERDDEWCAPALVDFARWHPDPVGAAPESAAAWGHEELVGNGWEWTSTVFAPREGFVAWARTYPGYSADFFDGEHDVVFGGSWATDRSLLRRSFRNWYRREYPHAFTSFRVAYPKRGPT